MPPYACAAHLRRGRDIAEVEAPDGGDDLRDQVRGRAQGSGEGELRLVLADLVQNGP